MEPGQQRQTKGHVKEQGCKHVCLPGRRGPTGVTGEDGREERLGAEDGWGRGRAGPHLISWPGPSAFWALQTRVSCSSRCLSCSQVWSLLQMKDSGHSLKTLKEAEKGGPAVPPGLLTPAREHEPPGQSPVPSLCRGTARPGQAQPEALVAPHPGGHTAGFSREGTEMGHPAGVVVCSQPLTGN